MKRSAARVVMLGLMVVLLFPLLTWGASSAAKKPLPQVPVTYPGDTDETIMRRAKWIDGAKKEGELIWWGSRSPSEGNVMLAEFAKIYPFVKGTYWRGRGEEVAAKAESEHASGRNSVDLLLGGEPYNYPRWRKTGIIEKFTHVIPGLEKWDRGMYSKHGDWVQPGNSPKGPQYNTKLVSTAAAPKSWEDVLDPKWKGRIALQTDMNMWVILALTEGGWGIEKTEAFLQELKQQNPIWVSGGSAGHALLVAGEFKIMVDADLRNYLQKKDQGAPVAWARVKPIPVSGAAFTLQRKAPHPNAGRLFLEFILSPQGLAIYEKATKLGAVFPGAGTHMARELDGMAIVNRTEEVIQKAVDLDLEQKFAKILGVTPR